MDFLNPILTFPGLIIANLLHDFLGIIWLIFLAVIIGLLAFHFLYKKREFFYIALILSSILLAFTPSTFGFASYDSKMFWVFLFSSTATGFVYYFIEKRNLPPVRIDPGSSVASQEIEEYGFYRRYYFFLTVLIFILAFHLRTFKIEQYPAGYSFWELNTPLGVIDYDSGRYDLNQYRQLFKIREVNFSNDSPIVMGLAVPFYKIFGISLVTGRHFSFVLGMLGLLFLFLYLRELFPPGIVIFLFAFTALELVNVIFSRIGFFHITSFTYSLFVLYLMEISFKQKKFLFSVLLSFLLGLILFGSVYLYRPTKAILLIVIVLLIYKAMFRKGFFIKNVVPLCVFFVTFSLVIYIYTQGNLRALWPQYLGYLSLGQSTPIGGFLKDAFHTLQGNLKGTFNRTAFTGRAVDSLSKFKEGGLISGPVLCFIPFAVGYTLAGIRREGNFSIMVMAAVALLPPILTDFPNASRLLLFLSLLLILPGMTAYSLLSQIQRSLTGKVMEFMVVIPALFFVSLFSYNLYIFIDINSNIVKRNSVAIPFAESGFNDKRFSRYTTDLAKEIGEFTKREKVFFYYSDIFSENPTAPNGAYEQFLIESYKNIKKGGKLVWMNPFYSASPGYVLSEKPHFFKFETALRMVLESDQDAKVIFIKPLADEMVIYKKLKTIFPDSKSEASVGDEPEDKVLILTISRNGINPTAKKLFAPADGRKMDNINGNTLSQMIKQNINRNFSFDGYFLLDEDSDLHFINGVSRLFEVEIDNYKITDQIKKLSLLKGMHRVKIMPLDKRPSTIAYTSKLEDFFAFFISLSLPTEPNGTTGEIYPHTWSVEKSIPFLEASFPHSLYYNEAGGYVYSYFYRLLNKSGTPLTAVDDYRGGISKIVQREDKTFVIRYFPMNRGYFTVYDSNYNKIKDFDLDGYPFDMFIGKNGDIYITYLNRNKITVIKSNYFEETWDTSSFSDFPVWNGAIDKKSGDIVLLSGDGKIFVFDQRKNLYRKFNVDASWSASTDLVRYRGGVLVADGIVHVLDPAGDSIKSYDKNGLKLYGSSGNSLFKIPRNFIIVFMQRLKDKIVLTGWDETGMRMLLLTEN